jgi:hypothetical protein
MRVLEAIARLYGRGIDCGLESFQGNGATAWVVDSRNRRIEKRFELERLDEIPDWLVSTAAALNAADDGLSNAHDLLAELAASPRKNPKRVETGDRHTGGRQTGGRQTRNERQMLR